ncbi:hypothetical protein ES708_22117 [subsurface metagenome]
MSEKDRLIEEARRLVAEYDETKRQRATLPGAGLVPGQVGYYPTKREPRSLNLTDHDRAFLAYVRSGKESKALVENEAGQRLVSPVITVEIERKVEELVTIRRLASKRSLEKDRIQIRAMDEATMSWGKLETGTDIPEKDLTPSIPVFKYCEDLYGLSKIGEDELMDSDIGLANYLADSFGRAIAQTENLAFIAGLGHESQQPDGLIADITLKAATKYALAATTVIINDFLQLIYAVPAAYRKGSTFIVNSLTELELRKLRWKTGTDSYEGGYLWQPSVQAGVPPTFLGFAIECDDNMPTIEADAIVAIFGNFARGYKVLDRKGMTIQRLTELYSEAGLVGFKCHARVGGYLIKPSNAALVLLTMAASD